MDLINILGCFLDLLLCEYAMYPLQFNRNLHSYMFHMSGTYFKASRFY